MTDKETQALAGVASELNAELGTLLRKFRLLHLLEVEMNDD